MDFFRISYNGHKLNGSQAKEVLLRQAEYIAELEEEVANARTNANHWKAECKAALKREQIAKTICNKAQEQYREKDLELRTLKAKLTRKRGKGGKFEKADKQPS